MHASAAHAQNTDWRQIAAPYDRLVAIHPSPVVALNRAVAVAMTDGPVAALPMVDALEESLADYYRWHATRAERRFLSGRMRELTKI